MVELISTGAVIVQQGIRNMQVLEKLMEYLYGDFAVTRALGDFSVFLLKQLEINLLLISVDFVTCAISMSKPNTSLTRQHRERHQEEHDDESDGFKDFSHR
ncbi:hypothetical protein BRARA_A00768 [Brassica rapa]|uniref:Uncharacterized protein n=1 Tax=Brassica campestris TaxID=3711 RepID=A0A398ALP0_BRACM|nr:hypothetical protein BRARA_A00768 [Brassica rapa]